jgi:hypothetical protein
MNHTLATQTTTKRPAPKQPQDRKPKAPVAFHFEVGGKDYTLPFVNKDIVNQVPGRIVEGAMLDGEEGQAAMAFALLRAVPDHEEEKEALRDLPFPEMIGKLLAWLKAGAAPLGESQG